MWLWRRLLGIRWTEHNINAAVLDEVTERILLIIKNKATLTSTKMLSVHHHHHYHGKENKG